MTQQELQKLIQDLQALPKECEWVEFKVNNSEPHTMGENISALSNSACYEDKPYGYLVYGIQDGTHEIVGTTFKPNSDKIKGQELENWIATQLNPKIDFNIFEFEFKGFHLAVFKVHASMNTPVEFKDIPYIRIGSITKKLKDHPEKARKIWNKTQTNHFEESIATANVNGNEVLQLIDYPNYFDLTKQPLPVNRDGILDKLLQDKLIRKNGGDFDITNLGAILFAKDIRKFDSLSRKAVRLIFYDGKNRLKTIKEQDSFNGYAIGFERLIEFITERLPSNEEITKALREEKTLYPTLAIRELVANAIIHQDFSIRGTSPMIEVFSNRIEITNSGSPLIDTLRFIDHSPQSRNESLASFMRRINICEERGSGIDKVISGCELYQLPAPEFISGDNFTRVVLYAPKAFSQMDRNDKVRACFQHCVLRYVSGENMTNESLRERFGIEPHNYATASRIISDAIESKLVKDYDPDNKSRKYAKYVPFWV